MNNEGAGTGLIRWLGTADCNSESIVGGKAASLSRLAAAYPVPPGFVISAMPPTAVVDAGLARSISESYERLARMAGEPEPAVAVRSSAVDEDGIDSSFAGQHATYLNVRSAPAVVAAVQRCLRSGASDVATTYRAARHLTTEEVRLAVIVQLLVPADSAAVVFSANPVTGDRGEVMINANWGLGESIVGGTVTPDMFVLDKEGLSISSRDLGAKELATVRTADGTEDVSLSAAQQQTFCLSDPQVMELARLAVALEAETGRPVDLECAFAGDRLYLLQCRPITTLS